MNNIIFAVLCLGLFSALVLAHALTKDNSCKTVILKQLKENTKFQRDLQNILTEEDFLSEIQNQKQAKEK